MSNNSENQAWREGVWRRARTADEARRHEQWLKAHPELAQDWQIEEALTAAIEKLPDVPVASNFTSRVLQAAQRDEARRAPRGLFAWTSRFRWFPKVAFAALFIVSALVTSEQVRRSERVRMLESVSLVAEVATVPSREALQDFEAVRVLSQAPQPDEELLRLLQ